MTIGLPKSRVYGAPRWPSIVPRAPLPPLPEPVDYDHVLPFVPPPRSLDFYRGNFCGLTLPGAPAVPGGSEDTDLVMAALLDNYPREWQDKYLWKYAEQGLTHLQRSVGHSIYYGHSLAEHVELSKRAQALGLWCDEWFLGAEAFNARDADVDHWRPIFDPIIDRLLGEGVVDHACVGWQLDQFNVPGNRLIAIIKYFADALPNDIPLFTHWANEALAWWKTGGETWTDEYGSIDVTDRFTWWQAMQPYLTGGHHQGDVDMAITDPRLYQDKVKDTLDYFHGRRDKGSMGQSRRSGAPKDFSLVIFECTAQGRFGQPGRSPWVSEAQQALTGYLLSCTTSFNGRGVAGYGNDACLPDGTRL